MAMKISCITSPLANQALNARPGEEILVGETPAEYAEHISNLLDNPTLAGRIAENGYQFILKKYSWETETAKIHDLISGNA